MSLFEELKRRNVFRVVIAYLAGGWLLIQIVETIFPAFGLGDFAIRTTVIVLAIGLIPVLILSWAFELTPEGIRKDSDVDRGQPGTRHSDKRLDRVIMLVLALALGYFAIDKFVLDPARDAAIAQSAAKAAAEQAVQEIQDASSADYSIAVLPFVNMSDDASNEYFSDGLSEELLNLLVRIPELRVAARTSSFSYKGKDTQIAQIGAELNVGHVLEGSVRKSGNQIRITVQLIQASDGFHVWSRTYDRTLEDIFVTQDEIAAAVVENLRVTLLGDLPEQRPTDPEVYTLYLRANYFSKLGGAENAQIALDALEQALALDPEYAPAWSLTVYPYEALIRSRDLPQDEGLALAMHAQETALQIDERLAPAWARLAWLKRAYFRDWQGANDALDTALQLEPNNPSTVGAAASIASALGEFDRAIRLFEQNVEADPSNLSALNALGSVKLRVGRIDEARTAYERVMALNPDYRGVRFNIAFLYLIEGRPEEALARLDELANDGARRLMKAMALFAIGDGQQAQLAFDEFMQAPSPPDPRLIAVMHTWRGEYDEAFEWLEIAFEQGSRGLSSILSNSTLSMLSDDPRYPVFLEKLGLREAWEAMPPEYGGPAE